MAPTPETESGVVKWVKVLASAAAVLAFLAAFSIYLLGGVFMKKADADTLKTQIETDMQSSQASQDKTIESLLTYLAKEQDKLDTILTDVAYIKGQLKLIK